LWLASGVNLSGGCLADCVFLEVSDKWSYTSLHLESNSIISFAKIILMTDRSKTKHILISFECLTFYMDFAVAKHIKYNGKTGKMQFFI